MPNPDKIAAAYASGLMTRVISRIPSSLLFGVSPRRAGRASIQLDTFQVFNRIPQAGGENRHAPQLQGACQLVNASRR
jgi:hypothetical protein